MYTLLAEASAARAQQLPVIDMHLHALAADAQGPPPLGMYTPLDPYPPWDPAVPFPAAFLERFRKRDVLYDNAARFLRLSPEVIARHHAARR